MYELKDILMITSYHGENGIVVVFKDRKYYCSCGFIGDWR